MMRESAGTSVVHDMVAPDIDTLVITGFCVRWGAVRAPALFIVTGMDEDAMMPEFPCANTLRVCGPLVKTVVSKLRA